MFDCLEHVSVEVSLILFIYLVNKTGQELVVSSVPTLTGDMFAWSSERAGFFMAFMGATVLPANILVSRFASTSEDRVLVPFLSILSLCSIVLLIDTQVIEYSWAQVRRDNSASISLPLPHISACLPLPLPLCLCLFLTTSNPPLRFAPLLSAPAVRAGLQQPLRAAQRPRGCNYVSSL